MSSSVKIWINALRPKTLPAGMIPVMIGGSVAYSQGYFDGGLLAITLICALLIQIITNFINEIYDYKRGADGEDRLGPERAVSTGKINPKTMKIVSLVLIGITFFIGLILVDHAGIGILIVGIVSLIFAWAYTGGPFPLAYKGLSDIFVFIFFGLIAVSGTYYVQTLRFDWIAFLSGIAPGIFSMNILAVNNIRDINSDPSAGKITLAVRLGKKNAQILYAVLTILAYIPLIMIYIETENTIVLLPLITIVYAAVLIKNVFSKTGKELNAVLAGTGKLLFAYGLLFCLSLIMSK